MGAQRVTSGLIVQRTLNNLNAQTRRILQLQDQLSTGRRVVRPSDDPIDARRAVNVRALISQNEQYLSNIDDISPFLTETTSTIQRVVDVLQRVRELTTQGASETNGQDQLDAIAAEINQLLEDTVDSGNHQTNGRYIFGGTRTRNAPFTVTRVGGEITAVNYVGNQERIEVSVSDGSRVVVNEPGDSVFQSSVDVFQVLIDIRDDLQAGNQASLQNVRLAELNTAIDQELLPLARVGAVQNRLERVAFNTEDFVIQLEKLLSEKVDADFAEVMVDLNSQSNAFQAALNAAGRVIQPSLLDFLR